MSDFQDTEFNSNQVKIIANGVEEAASEFDYDLDNYPNFNDLYGLLVDRGIIDDERVREANISISVHVEVAGSVNFPGCKDDDDVAREIAGQVEDEIANLISGANMSGTFSDNVEYDVDVQCIETQDWNVSS